MKKETTTTTIYYKFNNPMFLWMATIVLYCLLIDVTDPNFQFTPIILLHLFIIIIMVIYFYNDQYIEKIKK
jgi:hypothetical protein